MHRSRKREQGLTLLEAIILMTILSIVALGFGVGMQANARVPGAVDFRLAVHARLVEKMEELSTLDFATLAGGTALSDVVTLGGRTYPRDVTVTRCDADGVGGPDPDFVEIKVAVLGHSLKTRLAQR